MERDNVQNFQLKAAAKEVDTVESQSRPEPVGFDSDIHT